MSREPEEEGSTQFKIIPCTPSHKSILYVTKPQYEHCAFPTYDLLTDGVEEWLIFGRKADSNSPVDGTSDCYG
jgi:hypothetical protein